MDIAVSPAYRSLLRIALLYASLAALAVPLRTRLWSGRTSTVPRSPGETVAAILATESSSISALAKAFIVGPAASIFQFVSAKTGTYAYLIHDLAPARFIAELTPTVWVRSDRSGIQLLARGRLPAQHQSQTGQPDSALVAGTSYTRTDSWEQLRIEDLPKLAAAQARVLRGEFKRDVDTREAFIDRLLLNIYTGAGQTQLWIDDLEVAGFVGEAAFPGMQSSSPNARRSRTSRAQRAKPLVPARPPHGARPPSSPAPYCWWGGVPFFLAPSNIRASRSSF